MCRPVDSTSSYKCQCLIHRSVFTFIMLYQLAERRMRDASEFVAQVALLTAHFKIASSTVWLSSRRHLAKKMITFQGRSGFL